MLEDKCGFLRLLLLSFVRAYCFLLLFVLILDYICIKEIGIFINYLLCVDYGNDFSKYLNLVRLLFLLIEGKFTGLKYFENLLLIINFSKFLDFFWIP